MDDRFAIIIVNNYSSIMGVIRLRTLFILFSSVSLGLVLGIFGGLRTQQHTDRQIHQDFMIAAVQRAALVRKTLLDPLEYIATLDSFFRSSEQIDPSEYDSFIHLWEEEVQGITFFAMDPHQKSLKYGNLEIKGFELIQSFFDDCTVQSLGEYGLVIPDHTRRGKGHYLYARMTRTQRGEETILCFLMNFAERVELAVESGSIWGLPVSIRMNKADNQLLYFFEPRMDALQGQALLEPEAAPVLRYEETLELPQLPLLIQVDASPAYRARVRRTEALFAIPAIFLTCVLLGILAAWLEWLLYRADITAKDARGYLETMFRLNPDILLVLDRTGLIITANEAWTDFLGYSIKELQGKTIFEYLIPEDREINQRALQNIAGEIPFRAFVNHYKAKDGSIHSLEWRATMHGKTIFAAARDVTERLDREEELKKVIQNKDVLLREVHHRVKNNLQIIISMLNLQQFEDEDPKLCMLMERAQNRIRSMSLVHESLYQADNLESLDIYPYIQALVSVFSQRGDGKLVHIRITTDPLFFTLDLAIHCGLMINELATNAAKYAFPYTESPSLHISIKEQTPGTLLLLVEDNGPGLPKAFNPELHGHLGMKLINALLSQMSSKGAEFQLSSGSNGIGTRVSILFMPPVGSYSLRRRREAKNI